MKNIGSYLVQQELAERAIARYRRRTPVREQRRTSSTRTSRHMGELGESAARKQSPESQRRTRVAPGSCCRPTVAGAAERRGQ